MNKPDFAEFDVKPHPDADTKFLGSAFPYAVCVTIGALACLISDRLVHPEIFALAGGLAFIVAVALFVIVDIRIKNLRCPGCQHKCKQGRLPSGNWSGVCEHCKVQWDTGMGGD